ncbi:MAG: magnesium/cobalt transporter CorA [Anaerolineae bacterium]|jgi:magnesium transporter
MIQSWYRTGDGRVQTDLRPEAFAVALEDPQALLWVDLLDEPVEACEPILRETFRFHPLAVDDALEETHVPRVDDWGTYLYLNLHAVAFDQAAEEPLRTVELDIFLGSNYLVTYHTEPIAGVGRAWTACQRGACGELSRTKRHRDRGAGYLLYRLADELVAHLMPVVDEIDETIDAIEDQVFGDPTSSTLQQIFTAKRALLRLRRIIGPQREVLNKLARGDYAVVAADDRVFFRDVYDHLVRLHELSESLRDLVGSALDTYLSVVNNRMNEVMKVLTVITTLFMPLSFLAGFFGMNFFQPVVPLEGWTGRAAFVLVLAAMILSPLAMAVWMRRRRWL